MSETANPTIARQITLPDGGVFIYTIGSFELVNSLGHVIASLEEYHFKPAGDNSTAKTYKLYRTKERSWYDLEEPVTDTDKSNIRLLKSAIDAKENYSFLE